MGHVLVKKWKHGVPIQGVYGKVATMSEYGYSFAFALNINRTGKANMQMQDISRTFWHCHLKIHCGCGKNTLGYLVLLRPKAALTEPRKGILHVQLVEVEKTGSWYSRKYNVISSKKQTKEEIKDLLTVTWIGEQNRKLPKYRLDLSYPRLHSLDQPLNWSDGFQWAGRSETSRTFLIVNGGSFSQQSVTLQVGTYPFTHNILALSTAGSAPIEIAGVMSRQQEKSVDINFVENFMKGKISSVETNFVENQRKPIEWNWSEPEIVDTDVDVSQTDVDTDVEKSLTETLQTDVDVSEMFALKHHSFYEWYTLGYNEKGTDRTNIQKHIRSSFQRLVDSLNKNYKIDTRLRGGLGFAAHGDSAPPAGHGGGPSRAVSGPRAASQDPRAQLLALDSQDPKAQLRTRSTRSRRSRTAHVPQTAEQREIIAHKMAKLDQTDTPTLSRDPHQAEAFYEDQSGTQFKIDVEGHRRALLRGLDLEGQQLKT